MPIKSWNTTDYFQKKAKNRRQILEVLEMLRSYSTCLWAVKYILMKGLLIYFLSRLSIREMQLAIILAEY